MNVKGNANRSVRQTKKRLSDALVALLLEKPAQAITVRELTARAKVSRGTFYFHYTDISDLLHQLEQEQVEQIRALMDDLLPHIRQDFLPEILSRLFSYLQANRDVCLALYGVSGDQEFARRMKDVIAGRCLAFLGEEPSDRQRYLVQFTVDGWMGTVVKWFANDQQPAPGEMAEITWEAIHAVGTLLRD